MKATTEIPRLSPWGEIETWERHGDGVYSVSTPSHGGFWLTKERNLEMPATIRGSTFETLGWRGWYEEDCDWCAVVLRWPEYFDAKTVAKATLIAQRSRPGWVSVLDRAKAVKAL